MGSSVCPDSRVKISLARDQSVSGQRHSHDAFSNADQKKKGVTANIKTSPFTSVLCVEESHAWTDRCASA